MEFIKIQPSSSQHNYYASHKIYDHFDLDDLNMNLIRKNLEWKDNKLIGMN